MNQPFRSLAHLLRRIPVGGWVALLCLPALVPLMRPGFFQSDDGLFHAHRLAALDRAVRAGVLYPRWFPELAFGYGHPVLNFYGPLSYYWGLLFTLLGADAAQAIKLVFATGLVASALGMYRFARLHLDRGPALVAAVVYAYLPYHLLDLYVRGAVAEFLAFVWFPLILWAYQRLVECPDRERFYRLGLATLFGTALIATHSLSALIFAPILVVYVLVLLIQRRDRGALGRVLAAGVATVATCAFYWSPVLFEARYVGLGHGVSAGYRDHLLPWQRLLAIDLAYPYPAQPGAERIFPLGLVQAAILAAACLWPFGLRRERWAPLLFLVVALFSAFMLTLSSVPVWQAFEGGLAFLQYPWRFLALTGLATAFLAGMLVQASAQASDRRGHVVAILLVVGTGLWAMWRLPYTPLVADLSLGAMWQMDRAYGQVGTTWTGEYLPIWTTEQRWAISDPVRMAKDDQPALPPGEIGLTGVGHTRYELVVNAPQGSRVVLHQFYYPGWQARVHGESGDGPHSARPSGVLGLAAFDLAPGSGPTTLRLGSTPAQFWGTLLSLFACCAMAVGLLAQYQLSGKRSALSPVLLAICYMILAAVLLASIVLPNGYTRATRPVEANLEDTVELLAFTTDKTVYRAGDTALVTLYWRALREMDQDYKAFVHLTDVQMTRQPAQHDGDPGSGFTPTTRWQPGELVPDPHPLKLPNDLPAGHYRLWAGMYEYETVRNLTAVAEDVRVADNRVLLGEIEVASP